MHFSRNSMRWLGGVALGVALIGLLMLLFEPARYLLSPALNRDLRLGTSAQEAGYQRFGRALELHLERDGRYTLTTVVTGGSLDNLERLRRGELDMALVQGGVRLDYGGVSALARVGQEYLHLIVPLDSEIQIFGDLAGGTVLTGLEDTGSRELATALIDVFEFDPPVQVIEAKRADVGDVLQDGGADAALLFLPLRSDLRDALAGGRYRLVGLHAATALSRDLPGTLVDAIPPGTYGRNRAYPRDDLPTLAVNANLIVREDLDPRAIKAVLETVYSAQFVREMPLGLTC